MNKNLNIKVKKECVKQTINRSNTNENALTRNGSMNERVSPPKFSFDAILESQKKTFGDWSNRKDKKKPDKILQTYERLQK